MVTTLRLSSVVSFASRPEFPGENWQPTAYMAALRASGFKQVAVYMWGRMKVTSQRIDVSSLLHIMLILEKLGQQLGHPTRSVYGWLITKFLKYHNTVLEESAVSLCGIQPGDTVLELGHGPGLGLKAAATLLTEPTGRLIGVDYSKYMHQMAGDRLKDLVSSGKLSLYQCDVAAMPLADSTVDKVFHCNCYYYWPDLRKGAAEIHRIMKPGGVMVTTLRLSSVVSFASRPEFPGENWQPTAYMAALRASGFKQVTMEDLQHRHISYQAIYATADK